MYLHKSPQLLKSTFSDVLWEVDTENNELFLTFDDGPNPEITPKVLAMLKKFNAKATFFCVGENVLKFPKIFEQIIKDGHQIGNHTFSHNNGWGSNNFGYLKSYLKCQELTKTKFFRPPYGRISPVQYQILKKKTQIVMWSVLSGDFDNEITTTRCVDNVMSGIYNGSIIVFHDSIKAKDKVLAVLPIILENLSNEYVFKSL